MSAPKAYHHGDLRAALLAAARNLLAQAGYEALSQRALARELGVARSAPYFHFASREALLSALITQGAAEQETFCTRAAGTPGNAAERLATACQAYLEFAQANKELFRLMFASTVRLDPACIEAIRRTQNLFDRLVKDVMASADLPETNDAAFACWSALHGAAMLRLHGRHNYLADIEEFEASVVTAILKLACAERQCEATGPFASRTGAGRSGRSGSPASPSSRAAKR